MGTYDNQIWDHWCLPNIIMHNPVGARQYLLRVPGQRGERRGAQGKGARREPEGSPKERAATDNICYLEANERKNKHHQQQENTERDYIFKSTNNSNELAVNALQTPCRVKQFETLT